MLDHHLYLAIIDDPNNDELRLLFADWMDDIGDPRGDFIRAQLRLADPRLSSLERSQLQAVETELLQQNHRRWNAPLHRHLSFTTGLNARQRRGEIRGWNYSRGFVSHLEIEAATYVRHHLRIAQLGPIEHVRFFERRAMKGLLFRSPTLGKLKSIEFGPHQRYAGQNWKLFRELAGSRYLGQLRRLVLSGLVICQLSARALVDSDNLEQLQTLDVRRCNVPQNAAEILLSHFGKRLLANLPVVRSSASYRSPPVQAGTVARWASRLLND